MKEMKLLAKRGWYKAMIHQGTLSLIFTLEDFLISGPHFSASSQEIFLTNPNIFCVKSNNLIPSKEKEEYFKNEYNVCTYFILRPYIRGILYGLNPFYQMSLYVPCNDPVKINEYHELISKIDIGGQFFQDRIYWNYEALKKDIMDSRLVCLIYSGNFKLENEWMKRISIISKPFIATIDDDLTKSDHLFDLVEMRGFFEDVHQQYFSLINQQKKLYFSDMIRLHILEKVPNNGNDSINNKKQFLSTNPQSNNNNIIPYLKETHSLKDKETKDKKKFLMYQTSNKSNFLWKTLNTNVLLEEYGEIIKEQLNLNVEIMQQNVIKLSFAKILCRWNKITQRKSDILKLLMDQSDKEYIQERLNEFNAMYCNNKYQSENDLFTSGQSSKSTLSLTSNSSNDFANVNSPILNINEKDKFTTWYTK